MPEVETLMQEWNPEFEDLLREVNTHTYTHALATVCFPLSIYALILFALNSKKCVIILTYFIKIYENKQESSFQLVGISIQDAHCIYRVGMCCSEALAETETFHGVSHACIICTCNICTVNSKHWNNSNSLFW